MALFNVFRAENHFHTESKWMWTGKGYVAMGTKCFIAVGLFSVELSAYQVSMVCAALQIDQDSSIYIHDVMLG